MKKLFLFFSAISFFSFAMENSPSEESAIDLSLHLHKLESWAKTLPYRREQRHFNKHKNEPSIMAKDLKDYVKKAQETILDSFDNGFVIRTENSKRVAFFPIKKNSFGILFLVNMTSIRDFNGEAVINTFFIANGMTPLKTASEFNNNHRSPQRAPSKFNELAFIAYFKNGISAKGWQLLTDNFVYEGEYNAPQAKPKKSLEPSIDFLSIGLSWKKAHLSLDMTIENMVVSDH